MLPNGWEYQPETGAHSLYKEGVDGAITLGYYLNRAYLDDRYFVGEMQKRIRTDEEKYDYFVFDTKTGNIIQNLTESELHAELEKLNIKKSVNLVERKDVRWSGRQF